MMPPFPGPEWLVPVRILFPIAIVLATIVATVVLAHSVS